MLRKIPIVEMMGQDAAASSDPLKTTYYFHVHNIIVLTMFYEPGLIKRLLEQLNRMSMWQYHAECICFDGHQKRHII